MFCSLLIYGIVILFLPQSYTVVATNRVSEQIMQLDEKLSDIEYENAHTIIEEFCQKNQAFVTLTDGIENMTFGYVDEKNMLKTRL